MESLTKSERTLVQSSLEFRRSVMRGARWFLWSLILGCTGAAIITATSVTDFLHGEITSEELRKTIGFALVLVVLFGCMWALHRQTCIARSTIAKLFRASHCPTCGGNLSVGDCPHCQRGTA